jgi:hypothetical protein
LKRRQTVLTWHWQVLAFSFATFSVSLPRTLSFVAHFSDTLSFLRKQKRFYFNLDRYVKTCHILPVSPKTFTTGQAAKAVGITRATLQDWLKKEKLTGKFAAPKLKRIGNIEVRLWTASDLKRLRMAKKAIYQPKTKRKK